MILFSYKEKNKGAMLLFDITKLGNRAKGRLLTKPHYTRPRVLFVTNQRKCHCMLGVVNLGNSYFKKICEK